MTKNLRKITLITGDIILLYGSLWFALWIRYLTMPDKELYYKHLFPFTLVFLAWLIVLFIDGWYEFRKGILKKDFFSILLRDAAINILLAIALFYFAINRITDIHPQTILMLNAVIFAALFILWRQAFGRLGMLNREKILIIGNSQTAIQLAEELKNNPELGFDFAGLVKLEERNFIDASGKIISLSPEDDLYKIIKENKINTIVTAINPDKDQNLTGELFKCLPLKVNFYTLASLYETVTGKVPVAALEQVWFLENLAEGEKRNYDTVKRTADVILSSIALIITLPLWLAIGMMIKLNSQGSVFYRQKRVGLQGKVFTLIKFRSMIQDAENNGAVWASKNDSRVTGFGALLRKTRLDELPQFINILKGEMSFIGPRPERPEFVEKLQQQIPFYKERLLIKPGLSGWAQTVGPAYGGSKDETLEKLQYDLYYIKNRSLALDLNILLKTIKIVLSRKGI